MASKNAIKVWIMDKGFDRVIAKSDGTFEAQRTFFYTHGRTSAQAAGELVELGEIVSHSEVWNRWPKDSYFSVVVRPDADGLAQVEREVEHLAFEAGMSVTALYKDMVAARS